VAGGGGCGGGGGGGMGDPSEAPLSLQDAVLDLRAKLGAALPAGWALRADARGVAYFENAGTGESSWEVPAAAGGAGGKEAGDGEAKRLQKALEMDRKNAALKDAAVKQDLAKMKAETRLAKNEAAAAKVEAERRVSEAMEQCARLEMLREDETQRLVLEHSAGVRGIVAAMRTRDVEAAHVAMQRFRLLEQLEAVPAVVRGVLEAGKEHDEYEELVAQLRFRVRELEGELALEKRERQRENDEWCATVHARDEAIAELRGEVSVLERRVAELERFIAVAEERHAEELARARQQDRNSILSLEAQLVFEKESFERSMAEVAAMWPEELPPQSLLRKYVLPLRERARAARREAAQDQIRIGSLVQMWDNAQAGYADAHVTALREDALEVVWAAGSDQPPVWVERGYCFAVVPEDHFRQTAVACQTDVRSAVDSDMDLAKARRPRSARGRFDGGAEEADTRAVAVLRAKARAEAARRAQEDAEPRAARLFRLIDTKRQGELELAAVWDAVAKDARVKALLDDAPELQPLRRKEYLVLAWKATDSDGEITMALSEDEFAEVCTEALKLARRDADERARDPINALETIRREMRAAAMDAASSSGSSNTSSVVSSDASKAPSDSSGSRPESEASEAGEASQAGEAGESDDARDARDAKGADSGREASAASEQGEEGEAVVGSGTVGAREPADVEVEPASVSAKRATLDVAPRKAGSPPALAEASENASGVENEPEAAESEGFEEDGEAERADASDSVADLEEEGGESSSTLIAPWLSLTQAELETQLEQVNLEQAGLADEFSQQLQAERNGAAELLLGSQADHAGAAQALANAVVRRDELEDTVRKGVAEALSILKELDRQATPLTKLRLAIMSSAQQQAAGPGSPSSPRVQAARGASEADMSSSERRAASRLLHPESDSFQVEDPETVFRAIHLAAEELTSGRGARAGAAAGAPAAAAASASAAAATATTTTTPVQPSGESSSPAVGALPVLDWSGLPEPLARHKSALEAAAATLREQVVLDKERARELGAEVDALTAKASAAASASAAAQAAVAASPPGKQVSKGPGSAAAAAQAAQEAGTLKKLEEAKRGELAGCHAASQERAEELAKLEELIGLVETGLRRVEALRERDCAIRHELSEALMSASFLAADSRLRSAAHHAWAREGKETAQRSREHAFLLRATRQLAYKLAGERRAADAALLGLVEHKEVLQQRLAAARLAAASASNELEAAVAAERMAYIEREAVSGAAWAEARWVEEAAARDRATLEGIKFGSNACARLRAMLGAAVERAALRMLLVEELEAGLERNRIACGRRLVLPPPPSSQLDAAASPVGVVEPYAPPPAPAGPLAAGRDLAERLSALRALACHRERTWSLDALGQVGNDPSRWVAAAERERLTRRAEQAETAAAAAVAHHTEASAKIEREALRAKHRTEATEARLEAQKAALTAELEALTAASKEFVDMLHRQLDDQKAAYKLLEWQGRERLMMTEEDYASMQREREGQIALLEVTLRDNRHWIHTLQGELVDLKRDYAVLQQVRERELREQAAQKDQLRQELEAITQHAARLDNWVNSLKCETQMLNDSLDVARLESERQRDEHAKESRWLRWETWKRDETARAIGTSVDSLFAWFAEGLARLAGSSRESNERLAANGGVGVLLALLDSSRVELRRLALTALSAAAWDGHVDFRSVSQRARADWKRWVAGVTAVAALRWQANRRRRLADAPAADAAAASATAAAANPTERAEGVDCDVAGHGMTVVVHENQSRVEPLSVAEGACGPNYPNQERIGVGLSGRSSGVEQLADVLSEPERFDLAEVDKAANTLAVLSLEIANRDRIAEVPGIMTTLLGLCRSCEDALAQESCNSGAPDAAATQADGLVATDPSETAGAAAPETAAPAASEHEMARGAAAACELLEPESAANAAQGAASSRSTAPTTTSSAPAAADGAVHLHRQSPASHTPAASNDYQVEREDVQLHCLATLANLLFESVENQAKFHKVDGVAQLVSILRDSRDVDVLERCSGALSNATSLHVGAAERLAEVGGLEVLIELCGSELLREALDDAGVRIQVNCAEALVNATREPASAASLRVGRLGAEALVLLLVSPSPPVRQSAAAALGNVAQDDHARAELGRLGAVEALLTICEQGNAAPARATALWALSNLAWNAHNQDLLGRQLPQLVRLIGEDADPQVRTHAACALANCLFYHEGNRRRFGLFTKAARTVAALLGDAGQPAKLREHLARALGTACYNDAVAMQAGILGAIPSLIALAAGANAGARRAACFALTNIAVHDVHKPIIVAHGGVEAMTMASAGDCPEAARHARKVLEIMADMSRAEDIEARRKRFGVLGLVQLCAGGLPPHQQLASVGAAPSPLLSSSFAAAAAAAAAAAGNNEAEREAEPEPVPPSGLVLPPVPREPQGADVTALACEELNLEAAKGAARVREVCHYRGHVVMVKLVESATRSNEALERRLLQRAMWTLLTLARVGGPTIVKALGAVGAIEACAAALGAHYPLARDDQPQPGLDSIEPSVSLVSSRDVCEAAMGTILALAQGSENNCRRMLACGLVQLVQIADDHVAAMRATLRPSKGYLKAQHGSAQQRAEMEDGEEARLMAIAGSSTSLGGLALQLLQVMGPHSWVRCKHCGAKEAGGRACSQCGRKLSVSFVSEDEPGVGARARKQQQQQQQQQQQDRAKALGSQLEP
jgi:hypothetical protein